MPLSTMASAMLLIRSSLTSQPNLFHEFQPIGGVCANVLYKESFSGFGLPKNCCAEVVMQQSAQHSVISNLFMDILCI